MALAATKEVGYRLSAPDSSLHWGQLRDATSNAIRSAIDNAVITYIPSTGVFTSGTEFSTEYELGRINSSYYTGLPEGDRKGPLVRIHQEIKNVGLEVNEDYIKSESSVDVSLEFTKLVDDDYSSVKLQYSENMDEQTEQLTATFGIHNQQIINGLTPPLDGEDVDAFFSRADRESLQLEVVQSEEGPKYFISSSLPHSNRYTVDKKYIEEVLLLHIPDVSFGERSVEVKQEGKFHFAIDAREPGDLTQHAEKNEFFVPVVAQVGPNNLLKPTD